MEPARPSPHLFLRQWERWRTSEPESLVGWWLGHSSFLLCHQYRSIFLDPFLSNPQGPNITPDFLTHINFATVSHGHPRHLDPHSIRMLADANPHFKLIAPAAHRQKIAELTNLPSDNIIALDSEQSAGTDSIVFHGVASAHNTLETDSQGCNFHMGFIISWDTFTLYHSGDTVDYPGLDNRLRRHEIDLAFLPINGSKHSSQEKGNMWGREAAALARRSSLNRVIPSHYGLSSKNQVTTEEFVKTCEKLGVPCSTPSIAAGFLLRLDGSYLNLPSDA